MTNRNGRREPDRPPRPMEAALAEVDYMLRRSGEISREALEYEPYSEGADDEAMTRALQAGCNALTCVMQGMAQRAADAGHSEAEWRAALERNRDFQNAVCENLDEAKEKLLASGLWPWPT